MFATAPAAAAPQKVKALVLYFNPTSGPQFGFRKLRDVHPQYPDIDQLIANYIHDMNDAGGGAFELEVVERFDLDEFPPVKIANLSRANGEVLIRDHHWADRDAYFRNVGNIYVNNARDFVDLFHHGGGDYQAIINDPRFGIVDKIESGAIDIVWLLSYPAAGGFFETAMAGPDAYWINGLPIEGVNCSRRFVVMSHGCDRTVECWLEVTAHMTENIMSRVSATWPKPWRFGVKGPYNDWELFTLTEWQNYDDRIVVPGHAQVGTAHFPPNAPRGTNYAFSFTDLADSAADDWLNYPNFTGLTRRVNRETWNSFNGDYHRGFQHWWFSHIPRNPGSHAGVLNNWWHYIWNVDRDPDAAPLAPLPVGDQVLEMNTSREIPLTIPYAGGAAEDVTITVTTSDPELLPSENISVSGTGSRRTLHIAPQPDRRGWAKVTLLVSNTEDAAETSFMVRVRPAPTDEPARLMNLSVRALAGGGDQTLIMGFVVRGDQPQPLLVRGVGPGLIPLGLDRASVVQDPQLTLYNAGRDVIGNNNNWGGADGMRATFQKLGAFGLPLDSADAAIAADMIDGAYTAHVNSRDSSPGVALIETYDAGVSPRSRLVNVSARAESGPGDRTLIAGFVVGGGQPGRFLIRAVAESLADYGVSQGRILALDRLSLHDAKGMVLAQNRRWGGADTLKQTFRTVGAAPLSNPASLDAALVVELDPGMYTVQVAGAGDRPGIVLVEIYQAP